MSEAERERATSSQGAQERALQKLGRLYADLDAELATLRPRCDLSGRCCNFKESRHTLFASDLEIEWLARSTPLVADGDPAICPWWKGGLCHAREGRPLGCRVYFCDTSKAAELEELSARYHARVKRLHDPEPGTTEGEGAAVAYRYSPFVRRVRELASGSLTRSPGGP